MKQRGRERRVTLMARLDEMRSRREPNGLEHRTDRTARDTEKHVHTASDQCFDEAARRRSRRESGCWELDPLLRELGDVHWGR